MSHQPKRGKAAVPGLLLRAAEPRSDDGELDVGHDRGDPLGQRGEALLDQVGDGGLLLAVELGQGDQHVAVDELLDLLHALDHHAAVHLALVVAGANLRRGHGHVGDSFQYRSSQHLYDGLARFKHSVHVTGHGELEGAGDDIDVLLLGQFGQVAHARTVPA